MGTISKPLLKLKLLDCLRNGNFQQLEDLVQMKFQPLDDPDVQEVVHLILHYSVQVAPISLIKDIVSHWSNESNRDKNLLYLDVNHQDADGNTPLHLASLQSRGDVIQFLLQHHNINDCLLNNAHLQAVELCKNLAIAQMMHASRAKYVGEIAQEFRQAFNNRDFSHLEQILLNKRNSELLDINGTDPETGDTVLHEFVKKRDVVMVRWIIENGGDPFKRDKRGKLPLSLLGKLVKDKDSNSKNALDLEIKQILEKAATEQSVIDVTNNLHEPPTYRGYLKKWTNFAQGYKLRWLILSSDGTLSYYKDQDDTSNACRGSLNMSNCYLHLDSSERLKFEILSGTDGSIRWHLKGNHPIETNKWVWAIQSAIRFSKDRELMVKNTSTNLSNQPTLPPQLNLPPSPTAVGDKLNIITMHSFHSSDPNSYSNHHLLSASTSSISSGDIDLNDNLTESGKQYVSKLKHNQVPYTSGGMPSFDESIKTSSSLINKSELKNIKSIDEENSVGESEGSKIKEDNGGLRFNYDSYIQELSMMQRSISIEISSLTELLHDSNSNSQMLETVRKSLNTISQTFDEINHFTQLRDRKLVKMLTKQQDINNLWIKSVTELELELVDKTEKLAFLDTERKNLKKLLQKKISETAVISDNHGSISKDENILLTNYHTAVSKPLEEIAELIRTNDNEEDSETDEFFDAEDMGNRYTDVLLMESSNSNISGMVSTSSATSDIKIKKSPSMIDSDKLKSVQSENSSECTEITPSNLIDDIIDSRSVSQEEFSVTVVQKDKEMKIKNENSFCGYEDGIRTKLSLGKDNRPKISLWSVLKSMIGKDMTRMTLPVTFNEPTSLLQRVAEDLEYSELLDQAASFSDSTLRLLYVAVFAASSSSSTTKRVAKPFNPLLGETYEYCREEKHYRFFTEQVSHHPPISATWTESPKWDFWGESNVDSRFNGRSFDFKHLGLWYLNLRPDDGSAEDLYTWKKPNNTVIGILIGNPQVDNVGDVKIVNHVTGDYCLLHFIPRGWRATNAYEVKGEVFNSKGEKKWLLGGRWNDSIYAKKVLPSNLTDEVKLDRSETQSLINGPNFEGAKFLIWHIHERPDAPFNLTQFAITLNAPQPHLIPWLPPTDTRLRPDQRAMEEGRYDEAGDEKHRVEEKQRAFRKRRETNGVTYQPKWFTRAIHPITNQEYWNYNDQYWKLRKDHKLEHCGDIF